MRKSVGLIAGLAAFAVASSALAADVKCVRFRDIGAFSKVSDTVLLAKSKRPGDAKAYEIALTARCDYDRPSGNYFITQSTSVWECLEPGDVLRLSEGGACVVSTIKEVTLPPPAAAN